LTRLAGTARARELMFLSERSDSRRCEALGLVNRVVPDAELQSEAFGIARALANGPANAYSSIKDNLDLALSVDFLTSLDQEARRWWLPPVLRNAPRRCGPSSGNAPSITGEKETT